MAGETPTKAPMKSLSEEYKAQKAVAEVKAAPEENVLKINPNKTYEFELIEKPKSPHNNHSIGNTCTIMDPKEKRMRVIRYIPIADSIYKDEQVTDKGDKYEGYSAPYVGFHGGIKRIKGSDAKLVEFFKLHSGNVANKGKLPKVKAFFREVSNDIREKALTEVYDKEKRAIDFIENSTIQELLPIARVMFSIMDKDERTVKNRLRGFARHSDVHASTILDNIGNPVLKRQQIIQDAVDKGIIVADPTANAVSWRETKAFICPITNTTNSKLQVEQIANFTYQEEGERFFAVLQQKLDK